MKHATENHQIECNAEGDGKLLHSTLNRQMSVSCSHISIEIIVPAADAITNSRLLAAFVDATITCPRERHSNR